MVIELRGVEFINKGAELMLHAIMQKVHSEMPDVVFTMEQSKRVPEEKMLKYNIYKKALYVKKGINLASIGYGLLPKAIRRKKRIILESEIDVVMDGSGFAFGDQWGADYANRRIGNYIKKWKHEGKKVILLPQAFGPFSTENLRNVMRAIVEQADVTFAREDQSFEYLQSIAPNTNTIFKSPDFTNLIKGYIPEGFDPKEQRVAIIPNYKMIEHVKGDQNSYINFLIHVITNIQSKGLNPYFLIHEGERDQKIAESINQKLQKSIPIISGLDALAIKGIISSAYFIVCSRFHGVVSALSQGIPCMVTSWSHKYEMLVKEYEYEEGLNKDLTDLAFVDNLLSKLIDPNENKAISEKLNKNSLIQKKRSEETWKKIFQVIK